MNTASIWEWFSEHGVAILGILFVSALAYWLLGMITRSLSKRIQQMDNEEDSELDKRTETIFRVVRSTGIVLIVSTAVLMVLTELGVAVTPVLASVGFVGLALGLGAQTLVGDIISGLFILIENQYTVGDSVEINGIAGNVEEMNLRTTMVRDLYGTRHIIPNGEIRVVSNKSHDWSRAVVEVGITYDADVDAAAETLNEIGRQMMEDTAVAPLLLEPPAVTGIEGLDDWAVRLRIMAKTLPGGQWAVERHLRRQIRLVLAKKGIDIAFPRQDVMVLPSAE
ncbi:MAG: mechanosensitive ion channel family protein [Ardenticatenaceae bacterium]|nr:mechanosensitive ion channel family protein [Ardenticatenaceae bacterium]MCB9445316.1 mechanosensitive ion channel family protein [Ardenticatenaceae bacterium]